MAKSIQEIAVKYFNRFQDFSIDIDSANFPKNIQTIIVIPCFKEAEILQTLQSLHDCTISKQKTLVLILVNASENSSAEIKTFNKNTFLTIQTFINNNHKENLTFKTFINNELPQKHAGVGYARKILMDTALAIFASQETDGIIVNTDADCLFTKNYITELETAFQNDTIKHGVIHFEHRIDSEKNKVIAKGITEYELHLRYYKQALQWTGYPNVMHNIGSCMICRASTYALEGGMNKRKAGEDFYFMNKLAKSHKFTTVKNASVLPSCRTSDRVPFGTGKAMNDYIENNTATFESYDFRCFIQLKKLVVKVKLFYNSEYSELADFVEKPTLDFLESISFESNFEKIKKQSKNEQAFYKNFFLWLDHLKALQFIHYYTDSKYRKIKIDQASQQFLKELKENNFAKTTRELLETYRQFDKE